MSLKILDIDRFYDGPDSDIINMVGEVVGEQITVTEFALIGERLSGEDYTIAERFWPSLRYLYDIIKSQNDEQDRVEMTVQLAVTTRHAVWKMFSPREVIPTFMPDLKDCCGLFLETCFMVEDVNHKRKLLMGIAAAMGDSEAAKILDDLWSGYV